MRLIRIGPPSQEKPHVLVGPRQVVDVSDVFDDYRPEFFADGGIHLLRTIVQDRVPAPLGETERIGPPVSRPGKIVCIGLNYTDHAAESGLPVPSEPVVFMKATNTLVGPYDDVVIPRGSTKTDWEVELGVVVGRTCRYLDSAADGEAAVAGYMVCHDVSEREFQLERGGQWDKGKSCETFNPAGPWLVTPDEAMPAPGLELWLRVNGVTRQQGTTRDMIFGVGEIVRYLSQFMVLEPGDIINTGTPAGVALGRPGQPFLKAGDVVELGIANLGSQRQVLVADGPTPR